MKVHYIGALVVVAVGAFSGTALAYFTSNSISSGAVLGALAGSYFAVNMLLPGTSIVANGPPDLHE